MTFYEVVCRFNTGEIRKIDFNQILEKYGIKEQSPVAALRNVDFFQQVSLDSYGTLSWPNGFDFCPDVLYERSVAIPKKSEDIVT